MAFNAAHDCVVMVARETGLITESQDGETAATLPPVPDAPVLLGYTNLPQTARGLANSKGFALGQQGAAYNKRGRVAPTASVTIRPGTVNALANFLPREDGTLPYLALYVVVKDQYTDVYRFCKPGSLDFNFGASNDGGGELSIAAAFQALAYQRIAALPIDRAGLRALGTPLMWHDVRRFSITDNAGNTTNYRRSLMGLSAKIDYALERKNERPNWGDDSPLSRTSYELLEHHLSVSGEVSLHERLPEALFTGARQAQDWSDIAIRCSDSAASKGFTLTLAGAFPSDETAAGGESSAEVDHSVAFTADTLALELV